MKVMISAGGTGGHIYPALAILNKIKQMEPESEFLYIGTTDRMEATIIPKHNIPYVPIEMKGISRKNPLSNIKVATCFFDAVKKVKKEIKSFQPDVVLGFGGYVTSPVIYAASKMKIKTLIHEQNAIPGLSNKFLSHYADRIGVSLEEGKKYFNPKKVVYTGNPRSEEVKQIPPIDKTTLGFSKNKKLVLIVMGSLGSYTITNKLKEFIPLWNEKDYEVLLITGKEYYDEFRRMKLPKNVIIKPFIDNLPGIMKQTDLILSRAGASTIAEITALALPSILVPSPYVTHNHQMKNALELEKKKATDIIEEKNFDKEHVLPLIDKLLTDKELYQLRKENTKKLGVNDSATRIYKVIKNLIEDKEHERNHKNHTR